jgi:tetratricopeptide (TPR) repeat protein
MLGTSLPPHASFSNLLALLHREIRLGNFIDSKHLADRCLTHFGLASAPELLQLRAYTLAWEVFDSLGDYDQAQKSLHAGTATRDAILKIRSALKKPGEFPTLEFPPTLDAAERLARYQLWRQRVVALLAEGFSAYRHHLMTHAGTLFGQAGSFIYDCLLPAGFSCNGARSRFYFFEGLFCQRCRDLTLAAEHLDKALRFCSARLTERLTQPATAEQEQLEKAFAHYFIGRIQIHMGEVQFEQGRLTSARRHLTAGKALVFTTQDTFLAYRAELLLAIVSRSDEEFVKQGWSLLESFKNCRLGLERHPAYHLEASIEEVKTAVYLHHAGKGVPGRPPEKRLATVEAALKEIGTLISEARRLRLRQTEFHAYLVKARILIHRHREDEARAVIEQGRGLYASEPPAPLEAEAKFVRAKTYSSEKHFDSAARDFQDALDTGHDSQTFQASCHLQILEMLINGKKLAEAREYLRKCEDPLRGIESRFLVNRYEALRKRLDLTRVISFEFTNNFDLQSASDDLEKFYLRNLAALINRRPREITDPNPWRLLGQRYSGRLDKRRISRLLNKQFPARSRSQQLKPGSNV